MQFLILFGVVLGVMALCGIGMAVRLLFVGESMRAGCGSEPHVNEAHELESCGLCPKKTVSLCDSEDDMGTAAVARLATLGRFDGDIQSGGRKSANPDEA